MEEWRNLAMLERQDDLGQRRRTRGRLEMADVGFHRADDERTLSLVAEHGQRRLHLDRVAGRRPRAVRLKIVDLARRHLGVPQRRIDHQLLRGSVRRGQTLTGTVVAHRASADNSHNAIALFECERQGLEHNDNAPLTSAVAIGARVKRFAATIRRQSLDARQIHKRSRRRHDIDATGKRDLAFPTSQALNREVNGDQR